MHPAQFQYPISKEEQEQLEKDRDSAITKIEKVLQKENMLTQLGNKTELPKSPEDAVLEKIPVEDKTIREAVVRLSCPEFSSLCPITSQPDYAHFWIDYLPNNWLIESKSLKLFLGSFRNHGAFHESCTALIGSRLFSALEPQWMKVSGIWFPRGGISLDIFWQRGELPRNIIVPPLKLFPYTGR